MPDSQRLQVVQGEERKGEHAGDVVVAQVAELYYGMVTYSHHRMQEWHTYRSCSWGMLVNTAIGTNVS